MAKRREGFTMEDWEDEIDMRRSIVHNMKCIQQNAKANGVKTVFHKPKLNDDGTTSVGVEFGTEQIVVNSVGEEEKRIVFDDSNYIKVYWDRDRKLPRKKKKKEEEEE